VISIGGGVRQYQILISAEKIQRNRLTLPDIEKSLQASVLCGQAFYEFATGKITKKGEDKAEISALDAVGKLAKGFLPLAGLPSFPFEFGAKMLKKGAGGSSEGEAAYESIRKKASDFENGTQEDSSDEKDQAILRWKKARREGDSESARSAYEAFLKAGGRPVDFKNFIKNQGPLSVINKKNRSDFLQTLSEEEKESLKKAMEWSKGAN
jgi:hypothetical protein